MTRKALLLLCLSTCLAIAGCSNRSIGKSIDDKLLPGRMSSKINQASADLKTNSNVVVVSYNGVILLAGQTPRADLKELAERVTKSEPGVRRVHNELQLMPPSAVSGLARVNDATITSSIKTRLTADSKVPARNIKVVTENGVVFLMGLVSRQEANLATRIVQDVSGVQKIVRLFEYTN